jgi:hypothetical protein
MPCGPNQQGLTVLAGETAANGPAFWNIAKKSGLTAQEINTRKRVRRSSPDWNFFLFSFHLLPQTLSNASA